MRRIRNTSADLPFTVVRKHLNEFMNMLRVSGYDHRYRLQMIKGVLNLDTKEKADIVAGNRVRYRSGREIRSQKASRVGGSSDTWFLVEGATVTLHRCSTQLGERSKLLL